VSELDGISPTKMALTGIPANEMVHLSRSCLPYPTRRLLRNNLFPCLVKTSSSGSPPRTFRYVFFLQAYPRNSFVSVMCHMAPSRAHPVYRVSETLLSRQHQISTPRLDYLLIYPSCVRRGDGIIEWNTVLTRIPGNTSDTG